MATNKINDNKKYPAEPSRLERPEEHRKWAIAVANAEVSELRKKYNEGIKEAATNARIERDRCARETRRVMLPEYKSEYGKDAAKRLDTSIRTYRENASNDILAIEKKARAERDEHLKAYRKEILAKLGYPEKESE